MKIFKSKKEEEKKLTVADIPYFFRNDYVSRESVEAAIRIIQKAILSGSITNGSVYVTYNNAMASPMDFRSNQHYAETLKFATLEELYKKEIERLEKNIKFSEESALNAAEELIKNRVALKTLKGEK